jgi:hypothetical protein
LWPLGIKWRVFLFEPYPICELHRQPLSITSPVQPRFPVLTMVLLGDGMVKVSVPWA